MMKLLGILCIFLTCTGSGAYAAFQIQKQVRIYPSLITFLEDCANYIRYQNLPLQELLEQLADYPEYQKFGFLKQISQHISPEKSPEPLWQQAIQESCLPSDAKKIMQNLGHELGRTDTQGQLAVLALYQSQIQTAYENARTGCEKKSKLYQSLGWLGGAMLAILFF